MTFWFCTETPSMANANTWLEAYWPEEKARITEADKSRVIYIVKYNVEGDQYFLQATPLTNPLNTPTYAGKVYGRFSTLEAAQAAYLILKAIS
jgi:hypothetical protein